MRRVTQDSLRRQIGMVTQDPSLLHRSVRANILYGRPDASEAGDGRGRPPRRGHDFILGLADMNGRAGYDAQVGERGVKLSGGQRQRIALARVILKDAPILVLDEATSALDSEVEAAIQETLYGVMQGKTVIAIAHRLSTIAHMDRIVVLEDGGVAEEGTHRSSSPATASTPASGTASPAASSTWARSPTPPSDTRQLPTPPTPLPTKETSSEKPAIPLDPSETLSVTASLKRRRS